MRDNKTLLKLKEIVNDYVINDEILDIPVGRTAKRKLPDEINDFLKRFIGLLIYTDFISEASKLYIKNYYITLKGITAELNESSNTKVNETAIHARIWRDKKKIVSKFGEDMLTELIDYKDTSNLDTYNLILNEIQLTYGSSSLLDNSVVLNLPKTERYTGDEIVTDTEFKEFIQIILPYTKSQMEYISNNISKNTLAYCKYLLDSNILSERDEERKRRLLSLIK